MLVITESYSVHVALRYPEGFRTYGFGVLLEDHQKPVKFALINFGDAWPKRDPAPDAMVPVLFEPSTVVLGDYRAKMQMLNDGSVSSITFERKQ